MVDDSLYLQAGAPLPARCQFDGPADLSGRHSALATGGDVDAARALAVAVADLQPPRPDRDRDHWPRRRDPALLDFEEVGEVGGNGEPYGAGRGVAAEVADDDVFPHALIEVAVADDQQGALGGARGCMGAGNEGGGERFLTGVGQRLQSFAIDLQQPLGDHPRVTNEQSLLGVGDDRAVRCREAEAGARYQRHQRPDSCREWRLAAEVPAATHGGTIVAGRTPEAQAGIVRPAAGGSARWSFTLCSPSSQGGGRGLRPAHTLSLI